MIDRYSRPQMAALWSEEAKYRTWLDVEVLACEAMAKHKLIPDSAISDIKSKATFDTNEILEREKITKHDVAAFVDVVQKSIGENGRFLHMGMTSSDVVDTAFAYRLSKSCELLLKEIDSCLEVTKARAVEHKGLLMMGRTHGIHAEPTTMGLKWLLWHDMLKRAKARLESAKVEVSVGKLSGAVGNYANLPPEIEKYVSEKLGLKPDTVSTQVIARDRFASFFSALALLGSSIEAIAVELRHLQRTEVSEVREGFSKGQKGSSAMPHKRNPISAENLTGLARLLRGMLIPALENVALWHERDISHSSVERVIAPDASILCDYMVSRLTGLLKNLEVFPDKMKENLNLLQGVVFSQRVLLKLVEKGMSRDDAYKIVQSNAHTALDSKQSFEALLKKDAAVKKVLSDSEITNLFDPKVYTAHLDHIYGKVL